MARWFADGSREQQVFHACLAVAVALHGAGLLWLRVQPRRPEPLQLVTEVELAAPAPTPPVAVPRAIVPDPPQPATRPHPKRASAAPPPAAASAAPAAPLLTAPEPLAAPVQEPVRFVTDPNGQGYASGTVGVAGDSRAAQAAPAQPSASMNEHITPASDLRRQPLWQGDDCRGYFPERARVDLGHVALVAVVRASGNIARLDVQTETPPSQGFAEAARACIQRQRFSPALDRDGRPAMARTLISLRFSR